MKKQIKIASSLAIIGILMYFTVGLPTNVITGEWELHSIYEMSKGWQKTTLAVILIVILGFIVAQWVDESKGGKNVN